MHGDVVNQGIIFLGNKGSTEQQYCIQQLWNGLNDFFVTSVELLNDDPNSGVMVEDKVKAGDFLHGFYLGTRDILAKK